MPLVFPTAGTSTPVGLSFKDSSSFFIHQSYLWESNSRWGNPFMWFVDHGRGSWSRLKKMDAPGRCMSWALAHANLYEATSCSFCLERRQYRKENKTANVIVCLFAYFVQSVCQMQIESTRHLSCTSALSCHSAVSPTNTPSQINTCIRTYGPASCKKDLYHSAILA